MTIRLDCLVVCIAVFAMAGMGIVNDASARGRGGGGRGGGGRRGGGGGSRGGGARRSGSVRHSNRGSRPSFHRGSSQSKSRSYSSSRSTSYSRPKSSSVHRAPQRSAVSRTSSNYGSVRHGSRYSSSSTRRYAGGAAAVGAAAGAAAVRRPDRGVSSREGPRGGSATVARAPRGGAARVEGPRGGSAAAAKGPRREVARVEGPRGRSAGAVRAPRGDVARVQGSRGSGSAAGDRGRYRGKAVDRLPEKYDRVKYRGRDYYRWGGRYYRPGYYGGRYRYVGIYPPVGLWLAALPVGYRTYHYDNRSYYYYDDIYYTDGEQDGTAGYVVADPPADPVDDETVAAEDTGAPNPFDLLKRMSDYLGGLESFRVVATTTTDEPSETGQRVELSALRTLRVARPNKVQGEARGDSINRNVYYNGSTFTIFDPGRKSYGTIKLPGEIDGMLDYLAEEYGAAQPLADLLYSSVYDALLPAAETGRHLGLSNVGETICDHLLFEGEAVDWQIWIDAGARHLPRKLVITYRLAEGNPQYEATFDEWDLSPTFAPDIFEFTPPQGAEEITVVPMAERKGLPGEPARPLTAG